VDKALKLFALFLLAIFPLHAQGLMGPAIVSAQSSAYTYSFPGAGQGHCQTSGTSQTCTTGSITVSSGQDLVMFMFEICPLTGCSDCSSANVTFAVSDSNGGNTWNDQANSYACFGSGSQWWYSQWAVACGAAAGTYTTTLTTGGISGTWSYPTVLVAAVSGASTASGTGCVDTAVSASNGGYPSANPNVTSGSVGASGELILGGLETNGTPTGSQTPIQNANGMFMQWTNGPSSGTQAMTWTAASSDWITGVIALKHP
jgi:hypothetical protein